VTLAKQRMTGDQQGHDQPDPEAENRRADYSRSPASAEQGPADDHGKEHQRSESRGESVNALARNPNNRPKLPELLPSKGDECEEEQGNACPDQRLGVVVVLRNRVGVIGLESGDLLSGVNPTVDHAAFQAIDLGQRILGTLAGDCRSVSDRPEVGLRRVDLLFGGGNLALRLGRFCLRARKAGGGILC
jgi:hypothetical protein